MTILNVIFFKNYKYEIAQILEGLYICLGSLDFSKRKGYVKNLATLEVNTFSFFTYFHFYL